MMLIKITRESIKFIGSRSIQESFINLSLYYHIPHSITTAVITFMVGHLFQNYDTIYVRFFDSYTCDLSCFVGFFPKYVTIFFSNAPMRTTRAHMQRPTQAKQFTTTTLSLQATTHYKARKYFTDRSLESFIQRDHRIQVLIVN